MPTQQNKLHLSDSYLSKDHLLHLIEIQLSINSSLLHDIKNHLTAISTAIQILEEKNRNKVLNSFEETGLLLEVSKKEVKRVYTIINYYMSTFRIDPNQNIFISKPYKIAQEIISHFHPTKIEIGRNCLRTLEFFFPRSVLFGIFLELVNNAVKHNENSCAVRLFWRVIGNKFECEIHDSGKGILPIGQRGFLTIDVLPPHIVDRIHEDTGLSAINRLLRNSGGSLLFSASKSLGGAMVRFEFPILIYYKKGSIYGLKDQ